MKLNIKPSSPLSILALIALCGLLVCIPLAQGASDQNFLSEVRGWAGMLAIAAAILTGLAFAQYSLKNLPAQSAKKTKKAKQPTSRALQMFIGLGAFVVGALPAAVLYIIILQVVTDRSCHLSSSKCM